MASIKKNFIYNVSITLAQYVAGLIVFPYVSRCLGVELMGKTSFVTNVVGYFSLFALLGAVTVGTREIAACKNDIAKRSIVFNSIMMVIIILTGISLLVMTLALLLIPQFAEYKTLLVIGSFSLIFTSMQAEWLYQGVEKFDYIAKRSIVIKLIYCICIFIFIHDANDYITYYILTTFSVVINGVVNLFYARHYVRFSFSDIDFRKYLKPIGIYGVNKILISMYTTFNVLYLGLACNDIQVGYYSTANKLFTILLGIISAFTYVVLPRMSLLVANKNIDEFKKQISQSIDIIFTIVVPICIVSIILAPKIIAILAGKGYEGAILPMRIIMPVIILVGMAQVCIMQVLIPMKKDKTVLIASIIGAIVAILANIILVGKLGAIGSAIVFLLSELMSDIFAFVYVTNKKLFVIPWKMLFQRVLCAVPYIVFCYIVNKYFHFNDFIIIFLCIIICGIYFIFENVFIRKNSSIGKLLVKQLKISD